MPDDRAGMEGIDVVDQFVRGARVVLDAIGDDRVARAWDESSVLEDQKVSGVAGHLARGGVWGVMDYLAGGLPSGAPDFHSAGDYFATVVDRLTAEDHRSIRERGAAVAAVGQAALVAMVAERLETIESDLRAEQPSRLVAVIGGLKIRLEDYLVSRIVEQVVHLDDLARSVGHPGWPMTEDAESLVIAVGADIGCRRSGATAMVRALYRDGFTTPTLPVL